MDDQFKFYKHNQYLVRFLVAATVVFFGIVTLLWWQERQSPPPSSAPVTVIQKFSTTAAVSEITQAYPFEAAYIHDVEAVGSISRVFFEQVIPELVHEDMHTQSLAEVRAALLYNTDFGMSHVYNTSYYIGNLLIAPRFTLHELLEPTDRPYTTVLLKAALADIRAGVVKIQNYHDVAPPTFYNATRTTALYFPTPSFPSLTVSEAAMVFYILAAIDTHNARLYEHMLQAYAAQVFASGVHFRVDIDYALHLVGEYFAEMRTIPEYQGLLVAARAEWQNSPAYELLETEDQRPFTFAVPNFPYDAVETKIQFTNNGYKTAYDTEILSGGIRLSLLDTRLTPSTVRMYNYDPELAVLLPIELDVQSRNFPELGTSVGLARCITEHSYLTLSGEYSSPVATYPTFGVGQVFVRDKNESSLKSRTPELTEVLDWTVSPQGCETMAVATRSHTADPDTISIVNNDEEQEQIIGTAPFFISSSTLGFLRVREVYLKDLPSGTERVVSGILESGVLDSERSLAYFSEQGILTVLDRYLDPASLVPTSVVRLYTIEADKATIVYEGVFTDYYLQSVTLSPAGHYLAMTATIAGQDRNPQLLIFDINNGIIKKEVDLSAFSPRGLFLDGWTFF